jgi:protoporphyrinogen oxidase
MAQESNIQYNKRVIKIDLSRKEILFDDQSRISYDHLISTLPLNKMIELTDLKIEKEQPDPYTSVLVLNIGATRGQHCPEDHWLYIPQSLSGFHRVGFYNNVDPAFLPMTSRSSNDRVSIYVERAYPGGEKPSKEGLETYKKSVGKELQEWDFIQDIEVLDPTWIDVAYTWSFPNSKWKTKALKALEEQEIFMVGRYGRWTFQGIADSIRDGFFVGAAMKEKNL